MKKFSLFMILGVFMCSASLAVSSAPNNKVCRVGPTGGVMNTPGCRGKSANDNCTSVRASQAKCLNATGKYRDSNGIIQNGSTLTCVERICKDGYILWLHNLRNGGYQPYGLCQSKTRMQQLCDQGKNCDPGCKCVLNEIEYTWSSGWTNGMKTAAYHEDEMCTCQEVDEQVKRVSCKYKFSVSCGDDTPNAGYTFIDKDINITQAELGQAETRQWYNFTDEDITACENGVVMDEDNEGQLSDAAKNLFRKMYNRDKEEVEKNKLAWMKEYCYQPVDFVDAGMSYIGDSDGTSLNSNYSGNSGNHVAINNAKSVLSSFFARAESDASVWKNAEGKFNAARLASDLTSAVVLGTVGGVVSAVVIKKNQVKKGFESLECYIHGYKVADWGDVFEASLRTR